MDKIHKNMLLVEGEQEKRTIPYLIEENGIDWGRRNNPIVYIEPYHRFVMISNNKFYLLSLEEPFIINFKIEFSDLKHLVIHHQYN